MMRRPIFAALAAVVTLAAFVRTASAVSLTPIGTYATGVFFDGDKGAAEIPAYDWPTRRLFVVNAIEQRIDVLDLSNPAAPTKLFDIDVSALGTPNSVDTRLGLVAVAIEAPVKTNTGKIAFYRPNGTFLRTVDVGALPDMVTFSPNGLLLVVANEGEPDGAIDPPGSVSIIDLRRGVARATVRTADFSAFDGQPLDPSIIIAAGKTPSVDLEPEYITVAKHGRTAWVTVQEANAVAEVDLEAAEVTALRGLGVKNHGAARNVLDASDRDNAINLCPWTNLFGMYQPDGIASFQVKGKTYLITANEGDSREADESRVSALALDAGAFPAAALWKQNQNLGRLTVNKTLGLVGGEYEGLFAYGARSFSIWTAGGEQVFDSGDQLERITSSFGTAPTPPLVQGPPVPMAPTPTCPRAAAASPAPAAATPFNANSEESPSFDTRSDNKGPEPESVVVGEHLGRTYAFIGLERTGGIVVYDVSKPTAPRFETYVNPRDFAAAYELPDEPGDIGSAGDVGPEGLAFIPFFLSPNGRALLVASNEVSGTTTIYQLRGFPF
jgi:hypothetical protein